MPKFNMATIERWEHRVTYNGVEADSLLAAYNAIKSNDLAYDDQEVIECGDDVLCLVYASQDGADLAIPPEIGLESIHGAPADKPALSDRELATVLAALRLWQRTQVEDVDLLLIACDGRDDFLCGLAVEEIDALCERLNCKPAVTPESVMAAAMQDREQAIEDDRLQTEYGVPDELWQWVGDGFLKLVTEKPAEKTLVFTGPDCTTLTWIHPDHNAEYCHYYVTTPGDLANFHLRSESREYGDEDIDVPTLDDLLGWLADKAQACK